MGAGHRFLQRSPGSHNTSPHHLRAPPPFALTRTLISVEERALGIDIYLFWDGMTDAEKRAQQTGFRIDAGDVGYLREAYHGGPYATQVLVPEAFHCAQLGAAAAQEAGYDSDDMGAVHIPAATLRGRLEAVCGLVIKRAAKVYGQSLAPESPEVKAFVDFVELAERQEIALRHPRVFASF